MLHNYLRPVTAALPRVKIEDVDITIDNDIISLPADGDARRVRAEANDDIVDIHNSQEVNRQIPERRASRYEYTCNRCVDRGGDSAAHPNLNGVVQVSVFHGSG
jgi:hypothetical protein